MAVTRSGPGVTPLQTEDGFRFCVCASRLSFHPRHWRDWRSSVKSRCEPPNNGAVVEIVAYLKNKWKKGRFLFSLFHLADLSPWQPKKFSIFGNEQKRKNEQKKKLFSTSFLFFFFFLFNNSHRVSFFGDHAGCCQQWRCEEGG